MTGEVRPCPVCRAPELDGYPHRHDEPVRSSYDPMPDRPADLYCGRIDRNAYWTGTGYVPRCCLVHVVSYEYRAELPERMHPTTESSPTRLEPTPTALWNGVRWLPNPDGPLVDLPDRGALGGWPWSSGAARRFGGVTYFEGETGLSAVDYSVFPWAYAIERRLLGYCRRRHAPNVEKWPEHAGVPICAPLVRIVVAGASPGLVALRTDLPPARVRVVLEDALLWVWRRVSEDLNEIALDRRSAK